MKVHIFLVPYNYQRRQCGKQLMKFMVVRGLNSFPVFSVNNLGGWRGVEGAEGGGQVQMCLWQRLSSWRLRRRGEATAEKCYDWRDRPTHFAAMNTATTVKTDKADFDMNSSNIFFDLSWNGNHAPIFFEIFVLMNHLTFWKWLSCLCDLRSIQSRFIT